MSVAYLGFFYDSIQFNYKKMKQFCKRLLNMMILDI